MGIIPPNPIGIGDIAIQLIMLSFDAHNNVESDWVEVYSMTC